MKREIELILNSTHDAIIAVDQRGILTLFNHAAARLTKVPVEKALGRPITEVIPTTRLPLILQTGASELNRRQPLQDIEIITNRMPVFDEGGQVVGAIAVFRDITEYVTLAEEITDLKEVRSMLEAIFDATQDAISVVDEHGIGVLVNPAYTKLTGYLAEEVIGHDCTVDLAEGESVHLKVLETKAPLRNVKVRVGHGKKDVIVDAAPILVNGNLKGSVAVIHDITEIKKLTQELDQAKSIIRNLEAKYTFEDIKGSSEEIVDALEKAKVAADTPVTVMLRGESGTGKELFAHAIHNASNRKYHQFVRVNCAAISPSLLESELFGYEEGAFTGAKKGGRVGYFEMAHGGTIFLDEIGEITPEIQAKLLRVLQEKEIMRVGSSKAIPVDVRVIAATNAELEDMISKQLFRKDLYYRLNVFPITIPALRNRPGDLAVLVMHILTKYNQDYGRSVERVDPEAIRLLEDYQWPGNVRELENVIGRAMIYTKMTDKVLKADHMPKVLFQHQGVKPLPRSPVQEASLEDVPLKQYLEGAEQEYIERVLEANDFNRKETAKALGISIRSLYYKLEKAGQGHKV